MTAVQYPWIPARARWRKKIERALRLSAAGNPKGETITRAYLSEQPDDPQMNYNLGVAIERRAVTKEDRVEACEYYARAVKSPGCLRDTAGACLNNIGILCVKVDQIDAAIGAFQRALLIDPNCSAALVNLGDCQRGKGDFKAADESYEKALNIDPNHPECRFARGMLAMMFGDLKRGFSEYEHRFQVPHFPTKPTVSERPLWRGEDLTGKTILLTSEQGFGDQFQFIRYARELKNRWPTCRVEYYGHTLMMEVLRGADGVDACHDLMDHESFDYHCPIMSVAQRIGTTLETIPAKVPYITNPASKWLPFDVFEEFGSIAGFHVGLVWAGSPLHGRDKWRSLQPEQIQPLIDGNPHCQFYSLQVGPKAGEVSRLQNVIGLAPGIFGWEATAQALQQLDLLISVDTATLHLAGALGRPAWGLIASSPDFRWMLGRDDSPWYPTIKLFRQPSENYWAEPLERVSAELKTFANSAQ